MGGFGALLMFAGAAGVLAGFFVDSGVAGGLGGRVANLDLMNFKLLLTTAGGSALVTGAVLIGASEIRDTIKESTKGVGAEAESKPASATPIA